MSQTALLTVHGMGETPRDYAEKLFEAVAARLGPLAGQVDFRSIYYQDILKPNQETVWARVSETTHLRYADLRRFLLFGFGDAAGLENRKEIDGSVYELAQEAIARQLLGVARHDPSTRRGVPGAVAGLPGAVQLYLRCAEGAGRRPGLAGIWKDVDAWALRALGERLSDREKRFLAGATCTAFVTTGCNIPIFCAAHKQMDIKPIAPADPGLRVDQPLRPGRRPGLAAAAAVAGLRGTGRRPRHQCGAGRGDLDPEELEPAVAHGLLGRRPGAGRADPAPAPRSHLTRFKERYCVPAPRGILCAPRRTLSGYHRDHERIDCRTPAGFQVRPIVRHRGASHGAAEDSVARPSH